MGLRRRELNEGPTLCSGVLIGVVGFRERRGRYEVLSLSLSTYAGCMRRELAFRNLPGLTCRVEIRSKKLILKTPILGIRVSRLTYSLPLFYSSVLSWSSSNDVVFEAPAGRLREICDVIKPIPPRRSAFICRGCRTAQEAAHSPPLAAATLPLALPVAHLCVGCATKFDGRLAYCAYTSPHRSIKNWTDPLDCCLVLRFPFC